MGVRARTDSSAPTAQRGRRGDRGAQGQAREGAHFEAFREEDPLPERVLNQILVGVSTRNYESSLDKPAAKLKSRGTSKSAASRHLVSMTRRMARGTSLVFGSGWGSIRGSMLGLVFSCLVLTGPTGPTMAGAQTVGVDELQQRIFAARDEVAPALVNVQPITDVYSSGERRSSTAIGSGFIFDDQGHVVTNYHVAGKAKRLTSLAKTSRRHELLLVIASGSPVCWSVAIPRPTSRC